MWAGLQHTSLSNLGIVNAMKCLFHFFQNSRSKQSKQAYTPLIESLCRDFPRLGSLQTWKIHTNRLVYSILKLNNNHGLVKLVLVI